MAEPYQGTLFARAEPLVPYPVPDVDLYRAQRLALVDRAAYDPDLLPAWLRGRINVTVGGCWLWTGGLMSGYGQVHERPEGNPLFGVGSRIKKVHRLTYAILVRPIEADEVLDHLCLVKACCNPADLEPVAIGTNSRRGSSSVANGGTRAVKTHCKRGHLLPPPDERPGGCRVCTLGAQQAKRRGLPWI